MKKENPDSFESSSDEVKKTLEFINKIKRVLDESRKQIEKFQDTVNGKDLRERFESAEEKYKKFREKLLPEEKLLGFEKVINDRYAGNPKLIKYLQDRKREGDQLISDRKKNRQEEAMSILKTFKSTIEKEKAGKRILDEIADLKNATKELKNEIRQSKSSIKEDIGGQFTKSQSNSRFPSVEGLNWRQVAITFISPDQVRIRAKKVVRRCSYVEMGFTDRRKGNTPDILWMILQLFAQLKGEINWENYKEDLKEKNKLKERIKVIRRRLKQFFCLDEDPFEPYKESEAYRTKFEINSETIF